VTWRQADPLKPWLFAVADMEMFPRESNATSCTEKGEDGAAFEHEPPGAMSGAAGIAVFPNTFPLILTGAPERFTQWINPPPTPQL
jgi:hypothetical protein